MCDPNVKPEDRTLWERVCAFVDAHPRTGWYILIVTWGIMAFNFVVNLLQVFG